MAFCQRWCHWVFQPPLQLRGVGIYSHPAGWADSRNFGSARLVDLEKPSENSQMSDNLVASQGLEGVYKKQGRSLGDGPKIQRLNN